jgi:hypothetical protein
MGREANKDTFAGIPLTDALAERELSRAPCFRRVAVTHVRVVVHRLGFARLAGSESGQSVALRSPP